MLIYLLLGNHKAMQNVSFGCWESEDAVIDTVPRVTNVCQQVSN